MKTAVFTGINKIVIEECPTPTISKNKILIRIDACAVCTWEQRVYKGIKEVDFPFIGGHEIAAEIVEIGSEINPNEWHVGDKVVYGTNLACGDCYHCKTGNEQNCLNFDHSKHLEGLPHRGMGGFSQYMLVFPKHLFKYQNVTPYEASLAEPLSCVIHSIKTGNVRLGDIVVVIGCGVMGQLHVTLAAKSGAIVIASDMQENRLELAKINGAKYIVNPKKANLTKIVEEISSGIGAQVVFDTTPIVSVVEEAIGILGNNGRLVLYSSFYPDKPVTFSPDTLHKNALQILGTANSNSVDFMQSTKMISEGVIDMKYYVSEIYKFCDIDVALNTAIKGDSYRVVIDFN